LKGNSNSAVVELGNHKDFMKGMFILISIWLYNCRGWLLKFVKSLKP